MTPKRILVMPDGNWLAHVTRPLQIANILREMGQTVTFAGSGKYMELPRRANFAVFPLTTTDPNKLLERTRKGRVDWYDYQDLERLVEGDSRILEEIKPDLVLADFRLSASASCKMANIPLAVILNASWTNYYTAKIRPIEHSRISRFITKTVGKRITARLGLPEKIKRAIVSLDSSPLRKLYKQMGLPPCKNILGAIAGDLNLLCDIPEYGPTKNLPPNFHYVGPIVWEPDSQPPEWLDQIRPEQPTLYFTMGSTGYPRFFQEAIDIFGNTKFQCIMTTGGMIKIEDPPKNFFIADYAPGSKILAKSDVVICHGGNGTIYQAMAQGVPIVGIPTMHEQEFNMQRVVDLGIGIQVSELRFKPSHLITAIQEVLAQKKYRENAQTLQEKLAQYNGPRKGADLIMRMARTALLQALTRERRWNSGTVE